MEMTSHMSDQENRSSSTDNTEETVQNEAPAAGEEKVSMTDEAGRVQESQAQNSQAQDGQAQESRAQNSQAQNGQAHGSRAGESSTYNWVNPKLRGGSTEQNSQNPWSSSTGGNYWHYDERDVRGGSGTGGSTGSGSGGFDRYGSSGNRGDYGAYGCGSGGNTGGTGGNGGRRQRKDNRRKARKHGRSSGVGFTIGMALVFGAVAGLVMYAVYSFASYIRPIENASAAVSSYSGNEEVQSSSAGTGSVSPQSTQQNLEETVAADNGKMSVAEVTKACMPSVVTIATISVEEMRDFFGGTQQYQVQGAGTGVIIGKNDTELLIATNNHVVSGAQQLTVGFYDESAISATVKGSDSENDLAVVAVKLDDITDSTMNAICIATIGNSDDLVLGEQVVVIGNALGYGQSVTSGYVSALDRTLQLSDGTNTFTSSDLIQTDAAINSGNSGGALLNMRGELVGINEARSSYSSSGVTVDNVGYAIPMDKAKPILDSLMNQETRELVDENSRGYLGASFTDVTSDYSALYQMPQGVCITQTVRKGPADQAGLQRGDVITAVDDVSVLTYQELSDRLDYYAAGETVTITYQRNVGGRYEEQKTSAVLVSESDIRQLKQ